MNVLNQVVFVVAGHPVTWNFIGLCLLLLLAIVGTLWLKSKAPPRPDLFVNQYGEPSEQARINFYSMWLPQRKSPVDGEEDTPL